MADSEKKDAPKDKRSLEEMRRDALRSQDNLAADIDELIDRVNPVNAVTRWKNELVGAAKDFSRAGDGKSAATSPAVIAGGVIGGIALIGGVVAAIALASGGSKAEKEAKKAAKSARNAREDFVKQSKKVGKQVRAAGGDLDASVQQARQAITELVANLKG